MRIVKELLQVDKVDPELGKTSTGRNTPCELELGMLTIG